MFKGSIDNLGHSVSHEIDINSAIKSLSPRSKNLEVNTRDLQKNNKYKFGEINSHRYKVEDINFKNDFSPMGPSTTTLKTNKALKKR